MPQFFFVIAVQTVSNALHFNLIDISPHTVIRLIIMKAVTAKATAAVAAAVIVLDYSIVRLTFYSVNDRPNTVKKRKQTRKPSIKVTTVTRVT